MSSRTTSLALENPPVSRRELSQDFCSSVTDMFIVIAMPLWSHVGLYCQYPPGSRIPQLHRPRDCGTRDYGLLTSDLTPRTRRTRRRMTADYADGRRCHFRQPSPPAPLPSDGRGWPQAG